MPTEPQVMDATVMAELQAQAEKDAAEAARLAAEQAPPEEIEEEEEVEEEDPLKGAHDGDGLVSEPPAKPTNLPKGVQRKIDKLTARNKAKDDALTAANAQIAQLIARVGVAPGGEVDRAPAKVEEGKPNPDDFKTVGEYVEALTDWKAEQAVAKVAKRDEGKKVADAWNAQLEAGRKEFEDFDEAIDSDLPLTPAMQEAIIQSNVGYKVAYHLANTPDETKRIAALSPARQAAEIGKIEASLDVRGKTTTAVRRTSTAPEPISPLGSVAGRATNARKFEDMSLDEVRQHLKR